VNAKSLDPGRRIGENIRSEAVRMNVTITEIGNPRMPAETSEKATDRVTEVIRALEAQMEAGDLPPGTRLPSERMISEQMGVSRSVVREALNRLESQGVVTIRHGSGTVVESPSPKPAAAALERLLRRTPGGTPELVEVRLCLETTISALAAERRSDENLRRLQEFVDVLAKPGLPLDDYVEADFEFHMELARSVANGMFLAVLEPIQSMLRLSRRQTLAVDGTSIALPDHQRILDCVRIRDSEGARRAMDEHIRHAGAGLFRKPGEAAKL